MDSVLQKDETAEGLHTPSYMLTSIPSKENPSEPHDNVQENHSQSRSRYTGDAEDTIVFNVGGEIFETLRETLQRDITSSLGSKEFLSRHYRHKAGGYFFDRDPDIFRVSGN